MEHEGRVLVSPGFGMLLRHYRLAAGLSQEELAERARMSRNGIGALERGDRRWPQRGTLALLVGALALSGEERQAFEAAARSKLARRPSGASVTVGPWPDTRPSNLPLALTSFVGREIELDEIATILRGHRLVTLTGSGGVGKTQTALQVASVLSDATESAVRFVGLAPIGDPSLVATAVASALGVQAVPNHPLLETLAAFLKNKTTLLILDNCEHVVAQAAIVADFLLHACPNLRILATSRETLRAAGERTYRLPSLDESDAVTLFADRAQAAEAHFTITDESRPVVSEICRRLDGIPLAIELAAAQAGSLSVKALAKRLDDRFRILTGGERTVLPRHQTMRAAIEWSYNLLSAQEQRLFERLSVFAGSCTLAAATAVCADEGSVELDVFEVLSSLVDKSLVAADLGSEPRYRLLESFRQYAREKLASRGETDIIARRHAAACLELAERLDRSHFSGPDEIWRTLAQEELDNLRAALQWTLTDRRDALLGQQLVVQLNVVWRWASLEGRRWLFTALELVDARTPTSVLAGLDYTEASIAADFQEHKVELASSESAIARYRVARDSAGVVRAQQAVAGALRDLRRAAEGKAILQEALAAARKLGDRRLVATTLLDLGWTSAADGDVVASRGYIAESLPIWQSIGSKIALADAMHALAETEFQAGNAELAFQHALGALPTFRAFNHTRLVAHTLSDTSAYLVSLARYDEAKEWGNEALDVAREHSLDAVAAWALQHLVAIAVLRPQVMAERTATVYRQAARILGFVDARLAAMGSLRPRPEQQEYDILHPTLQNAMDPGALSDVMADGATMTEDEAVAAATAL